MAAKAQNKYDDLWKQADKYEADGKPQSVYQVASQVLKMAAAEGNDAQQLKAVLYIMRYNNEVQLDAALENYYYADTLLKDAKTPVRNFLLNLQAQVLAEYQTRNVYRMNGRTQLANREDGELDKWTPETLQAAILDKISRSLQSPAELQKLPLTNYKALLQGSRKSFAYVPTVYDFLAKEALDILQSQRFTAVTHPANEFSLSDPAYYQPGKNFTELNIPKEDSLSGERKALEIYQDLERYLAGSGNKAALTDVQLRRLEYLYTDGDVPNENEVYENALSALATSLAGDTLEARVALERAALLLEHETGREKEAHQILTGIVNKYPNSDVVKEARSRIADLESKTVDVKAEQVLLPAKPFKALLIFKNATRVYLRVVKSEPSLKGYIDERDWERIRVLSPVKAWDVNLPPQDDLQEHSTEIKVDPLTYGDYILVASLDADFKNKENYLSAVPFQVSLLAPVLLQGKGVYVVNRSTGEPLAGVEVEFNRSGNRQSQNSPVTVKTNQEGYAGFPAQNENYSIELTRLRLGQDMLDLNTYVSTYNNRPDKKSIRKISFYLDRAIYRPGQTVYYKGIVYKLSGNALAGIAIGAKGTVKLRDANGQNVGSNTYETNSKGSFTGSFKIPEGQMNGRYTIISDENYYAFNVEDYKRPKFEVKLDTLKDAVKLGDSVRVSGDAKAYAGYNIENARVKYRVLRTYSFPWWMFSSLGRFLPRTDETEIANCTLMTDRNGSFTFNFSAAPDKNISPDLDPFFTYKIMVDVTDNNGETHSAQSRLRLGYKPFFLEIEPSDGAELHTVALDSVKLFARNATGRPLHQKVKIELYTLKTPDQVLNQRYWDRPDVFIMSKAEHDRYFPDYAYNDEDDPKTRALGQVVNSFEFTTNEAGDIKWPGKAPEGGAYKLTVTSVTAKGDTVRAEKFITLGKSNTDALQVSSPARVEVGAPATFTVATAFDKAFALQFLTSAVKAPVPAWLTLSGGKSARQSFTPQPAEATGLHYHVAMVKNNRYYEKIIEVVVADPAKELEVTYKTFRNKTEPGSKETWTLNIQGKNFKPNASEALIAMYDASLDAFIKNRWTSPKDFAPAFYSGFRFNAQNFGTAYSYDANSFSSKYPYARLLVEYPEYIIRLGGIPHVVALQGRASGIMTESNMVMTAAPAAKSAAVADADNRAEESKKANEPEIQVRENLNETAFFFPQLKVENDGSVTFTFTMPEALTRWKIMTLVHDTSLASGYREDFTETKKELMIQPNPTRFVREGDDMEFSAKVVNTSARSVTGVARLELINTQTGAPVDGWFKNVFPQQYFTIEPGMSQAVKFPVGIPSNYGSTLTYRFIAETNDKQFSDGEQGIVPVLTNRMLVTESMPMNMNNSGEKTFVFKKLGESKSPSLTHHALTVEFTTNPSWYVVQALPYLMQYPYECAEQVFNKYYANALAANIVAKMPKIKAVLDKWRNDAGEKDALLSNLQKNQELKSALLEETPWVLEAKSETEQKQNIAKLFDTYLLAEQKAAAINKLEKMQLPNGAFPWFNKGREDRYITQYIVAGIGRMDKLGVGDARLTAIAIKAVKYMDDCLRRDYAELIRSKAKLPDVQLGDIQVMALYARSFYSQVATHATNLAAVNFYKEKLKTVPPQANKYTRAMQALALNRMGDAATAKKVMQSLNEYALHDAELGMYWKDFMNRGYYWYQAPVESQAMMIEAYNEILKDEKAINEMKVWLLRQKQVQRWESTRATADACYALLLSGSNWLVTERTAEITVGNKRLNLDNPQAGSGYVKEVLDGGKINPGDATIKVKLSGSATAGQPPAWGAAYWQYFEDLDKITTAQTPLKLVKRLYKEVNSPTGPILAEVKDNAELKIGDKVKVRIELSADRDMEYVHMRDMRAAAFEPVNVISEYKWQDGLGYYESTRDASTNFFFDRLQRGTYVFEYPMFVTHSGTFSNGITTIQCMYAPEFSAHSEGIKVQVAD